MKTETGAGREPPAVAAEPAVGARVAHGGAKGDSGGIETAEGVRRRHRDRLDRHSGAVNQEYASKIWPSAPRTRLQQHVVGAGQRTS